MSDDYAQLVRDLEDEQAALDALVSPLADREWARPTPAEGWSVRDQIAHLAFFDDVAALAIREPARFGDEVARAMAGLPAYEAGYIDRGRALAPAGLLAWWRGARRALLDAARPLDGKARVPWYGIPMTARSFVTARLMETWSHGQDVADGLGVERTDTDRLRHVAFLGVRTRAHSYAVRGLTMPDTPVRVDLVLPSGTPWQDGGAGGRDRIRGTVADFCLVVTQRRHVQDTDLVVEGDAAREWMLIAQAFAGPPAPGRKPGQFPKRSAARR